MKKIHTFSCQLLGALVVVAMFSPIGNMLLHERDTEQAIYKLLLLSIIDTCGMIGYAAYNVHAQRRGHDVLDALVYPVIYAPVAACWYVKRYLK